MILHVLDGHPGDRQFQEESPRRKDASKCQVGQEWQVGTANGGRVRFPRLWAVVRLNEQIMDTRGTGQIAADDQASAGEHFALADVLPSAADSVPEKVLASPGRPYDGQKGACLKPDLTSKCEFGVFTRKTIKNGPALFAHLTRFDDPPLLS